MTQIYLTMPQPGETITEGSVVSWMIPVGSRVKEGQAVVELETEKALFEYESPFEGKLVEILATPQSTVAVGSPIAILDVPEDKARAYTTLGLAQRVQEGEVHKSASKPASKKEAPSELISEKKGTCSAQISHDPVPTLFSPYIRHLLHVNGLRPEDLRGLSGHGPHGRPTKEDVEAFIEREKKTGRPAADQEASGGGRFEDVLLSPIRSRIAQHMVLSKQTIPHAHTGVDVDMTVLLGLRDQLKEDFFRRKGFPLRMMPLLFMALKEACAQVPLVNSRLMEKQVRVFKDLNLGMAMGTKRGLLTPVIRGCDAMGFMNFAQAYEELLKKSEADRLLPADFEGATFTFNNFGAFGLDFGVQVIPPGQACVLGMGNIQKKPWVVNDEIRIRSIASFFLAFDHRLMDGREAGEFLTALKKGMEDFTVVGLI